MGVTMDVALDGFNRCCNGCYDRMGVKTTYTGQEDQETLVDTENSIFCEFTNLEADYCCFWVRLLNLENSLRFDKKYFGKSHFRS